MRTVLYRKHNKPWLVRSIIAINTAVFLLWHLFDPQWMAQNFLVSWSLLEAGRFWVLITSIFSHNMLLHLFINMFVLHSFGSVMELYLGRNRFFWLYMITGLVASLSHAATSNYFIGDPSSLALGASGAIAGVILVFAFMFPTHKILLFAIIPIPAIWGALAFIALDLWGLYEQSHGGGFPIGHGAHLGGAFSGIFYYYLVIRPLLRKESSSRYT